MLFFSKMIDSGFGATGIDSGVTPAKKFEFTKVDLVDIFWKENVSDFLFTSFNVISRDST